MRGNGAIQANGLLFGARNQTNSPSPRLTEEEKQALERQKEKEDWLARGGTIDDDGSSVIWRLNDKIHREGDKPAVEYKDGTKQWFRHGLQHRENGPAVEYNNGDTHWYLNGVLHRDNGFPAITESTGRKEWHVHGKRHRENGPAIIDEDGKGLYYRDGVWYDPRDEDYDEQE